MKTVEDKKRTFIDLKLQIYAFINQGKIQEAQLMYNNYFLLYKDLVSSSSGKDSLRWHSDITRVYNKLTTALNEHSGNLNPLAKKMPQSASAGSKPSEKIKGNFIETDFDILLRLLDERGKMKLHEVEERFSIGRKLAEEWIQILADHDLVEIHYLPVGGIEISRFSPGIRKNTPKEF